MNFHPHSPLQSSPTCLRNRTDSQSASLSPPQNHCWCSCHQTTGPRPCWASGEWMSSPRCRLPGQTTCTHKHGDFYIPPELRFSLNSRYRIVMLRLDGIFTHRRVLFLCDGSSACVNLRKINHNSPLHSFLEDSIMNRGKCRHLNHSPCKGQHLWSFRSHFHEARGLNQAG